MSKEQNSGRPCLYTTPCIDRCTCINPGSSSGCRRCAKYGSIEQKQLKAKYLANLHEECADINKLLEEFPDHSVVQNIQKRRNSLKYYKTQELHNKIHNEIQNRFKNG